MTDYRTRALRDSIIVFTLSMVGVLFMYLLRLLLARKLSIAMYGLYFSALAIINLLVIVRDFGMRVTLAKYLSAYVAKKRYSLMKGLILFVARLHLVTSAIIAVVIWLSADYLALNYFGYAQASLVMKLLAVVFFISFVEQIIVYILQGFQRMTLFSLVHPLNQAVILLSTYIFLEVGLDVFAPIVGALIVYSMLPVFYGTYLFQRVFPQFLRVKSRIKRKQATQYLGFGLCISIAAAGSVLISNTDTVLITHFLTLTDVGVYQVALPIAMLLSFFAAAAANVVMPMASEMHSKKEHAQVRATITFFQKYLFVVVVPAAMLFFLYPEILIRIFFGEKFLTGAMTLRVLVFGSLLYSVAVMNQNIFFGIGRPRITTENILVAAFTNLVLNVMLIPQYGIIGAAVATSMSYMLLLIVSTYRLNKLISLVFPWRVWLKISVGGLAFSLVVGLLKRMLEFHWFYELVITGTAGLGAYILVLLLFRIVVIGEVRDLLVKTIRRNRSS
jgi:O-antigen/teichoic acid export membrane protein